MTIVILTSVLRQTHINSWWSITIKWYSNINFYLYKRCLFINNQTRTADQYLLTINRPHARYSQLIIKAQLPTDRTLQKTCHCNAQEHMHPCNKRSYSFRNDLQLCYLPIRKIWDYRKRKRYIFLILYMNLSS